jgi:hypothetical protein
VVMAVVVVVVVPTLRRFKGHAGDSTALAAT